MVTIGGMTIHFARWNNLKTLRVKTDFETFYDFSTKCEGLYWSGHTSFAIEP
jgi:hypothetical protein